MKTTLMTGILALALAFPVRAEDEEFPEGPAAEEGEDLPDSDEEEMEEEEIDVLGTLESIIGKMKDAEDLLAKLPDWRATDQQGKVIEDLDKFLEAKDMQEKAIREMSKIFDGSKDNQGKAIAEIEKLIKAAKESQGNQPGSQQKKNQQKPQQQPKDQQQNKSSNPAQQPYTPPGSSDEGMRERIANLGDKWGNLPDKLRDELSQAEDDFRTLRGEYGRKLQEYWRVLGAAD